MAAIDDAYRDTLRTIALHPRPTFCKVSCAIVLPSGIMIAPYKVLNIDIERDFAKAIGDDGVIEISCSLGDYQRHLLPNVENLFIEITRTYIGETDDTDLIGVKPVVSRYRAYLRQTDDPSQQGLPAMDADQTIVEVTLDITAPNNELIRMTKVGGIYEDVKLTDLLKFIYHEVSNSAELPREDLSLGAEAVVANNDITMDYVIIEDDTELINLPQYLNKYCGGIYNFDISCYFHNRRWFIFPTYDTSRYATAKHTVDFYIAPPNHMPGTTRTWRQVEKKVEIIITGETKQKDNRNVDSLVSGNGVKFGKASQVFEDWSTTTKNLPTVNSADNDARFVVKEHGSELQTFRNIPFTDNVAHVLTELVPLTGYRLLLIWENARPDALTPGSAVRITRQTETGLKVDNAVILNIESHTTQVNPGPKEVRYKTNCSIELFVTDMEIKEVI